MKKDNIPLWAVHVALLFTGVIVGVFPGQFLAANTSAGHHNDPALTAAFFTLSVVGIIGAIVMAIVIAASWISGHYEHR